ncbi:hypothetical protein MKX03_032853, partial [Papaver bracteatum]
KNSSQWNEKIKDGMTKDFSWGAECYDIHLNAYTSIKNIYNELAGNWSGMS